MPSVVVPVSLGCLLPYPSSKYPHFPSLFTVFVKLKHSNIFRNEIKSDYRNMCDTLKNKLLCNEKF